MYLSKIRSILAIAVMYAACIVLCVFLYPVFNFAGNEMQALILKILLLDIIATVFIFIMSCIFKNSSIYDPYWSVAPIVMTIAFLIETNNINPWTIIVCVLICLWGIRLTLNWAIRFNNLRHQDWRYDLYKEKYPRIYPLLNFLGIHLVPTVVVAVAMIPVFFFIGSIGVGDYQPSVMTIVAYVISFAAIIIETVADLQMQQFKKIPSNDGLVMTHGLWKNSRHPNYFGEILFWFSMFLIHFSAPTANPWLVFCPLTIFMLFQFVSIPLMDKRQVNSKPAYKEYMENTNALLPIFPPKPSDKK
jgi:steroid 5-alpha reductase family enzyme